MILKQFGRAVRITNDRYVGIVPLGRSLVLPLFYGNLNRKDVEGGVAGPRYFRGAEGDNVPSFPFCGLDAIKDRW